MSDDETTVNGGATEAKPNLSLELIVRDQQGAIDDWDTPLPRGYQDGSACWKPAVPDLLTDTLQDAEPYSCVCSHRGTSSATTTAQRRLHRSLNL